MRLFRLLAVAALSLCMALPTLAAGKKKKDGKPVKGTVVEVKKDEGKETGELKVKVPGKKGAAATDRTFKITEATKIAKITGKVKPKEAATTEGTAIKFGEVAKDASVILSAKGDEATSVKVLDTKKKKKKK